MASYNEQESSTLDFNFDSQSIYEENESSTLDLELAETTARATFDAAVQSKDVDRDSTFDAVIKNFDVDEDFTVDAAVVRQKEINLATDAVIENLDQDRTANFDIAVEEQDTKIFGFDSIVVNQQETSYTVDTAIQTELENTSSFDAAIESRNVDVSPTFDTAIKEEDKEITYTTDALVVSQVDKDVTFDAVISFGKPGDFTAVINGESYTGVFDVEVETSLNELHTFKFDAYIEDDQDRQLIQEGEKILLFDGTELFFKGELEDVNYESTFKAKCEGSGRKLPLLKRKTPRKEYINERADDIIRDLLGGNDDIILDTVEQAPVITIRVDHDNQLRAAAGVANAVGFDLYAENKVDDDYQTTYVNFVEHKGSKSSVATLNIAEELQLVSRGNDNSVVANDITILGRGDGINQKEARLFAATTHRTVTTQRIQAGDTTTLDVKDATQLGSIGDEVDVRVGEEVVNASIQDSTTLDILGRAQQDYKGDSTTDSQHYEDIQVFLKENKTQSIGPFEPTRDGAEDGSSIEQYGVVEERNTDKTLIDRATVEKVADNELKDRRQPVFRVEVDLTDPRSLNDLGIEIGDNVVIEDLTAPDVSNQFRVVGIDYQRASAGESTTLHCANRPIRLVERLSEIERDRDTLNAHMQGATNFNGESFEDNCDDQHPLENKLYVPEDVVEINKFELTFARKSFRGYVQNQNHSHDVTVTHPSHSHTVDIGTTADETESEEFKVGTNLIAPIEGTGFVEHTSSQLGTATIEIPGDRGVSEEGSIVVVEIGNYGAGNSDTFEFELLDDNNDTLVSESETISGNQTSLFFYKFAQDELADFDQVTYLPTGGRFDNPSTVDATHKQSYVRVSAQPVSTHEHSISATETSDTALGDSETQTSSNAGSPTYGIFEPSSEADVDVEVIVDGNTVTTINDVSVGDEINQTIDLKDELSDPVTGEYHDIELVPTGRCRLSADVVQKVFIESKL